MLSMANERLETLVNTKVDCSLVITETEKNGNSWRSFHKLDMIHSSIPNFSLPWTLMHEIKEDKKHPEKQSALYGKSSRDLYHGSAIIFVLVSGLDTVIWNEDC